MFLLLKKNFRIYLRNRLNKAIFVARLAEFILTDPNSIIIS